MKTFEQLYTAWVDGALSKDEAAAFEKQHPELLKERDDMSKLKKLLQGNLVPAEFAHAEFFTTKLMEQIVPAERTLPSWFHVPRLAWGGIGSLAAALALSLLLIPHGNHSAAYPEYVAEVIKTTTTDPKISATVDSEKGITLIKLDGVDKVPDDEDLTR
ncbi:MAG: hypothetical protein WAK31_09620 [Chthoniobacterales bacterium]|jgi:hypothetical protein